jgi:hypothetical protein
MDGLPDGTFDNSAYYNAPRNPYFHPPAPGDTRPNWGGWQKFLNLMDHLYGLIQQAGLAVGDVDLQNEVDLVNITVQGRFINDPFTYVDAVKELQTLLAIRFPSDPQIKSKVTFSTTSSRPNANPPAQGYCRTPYGLPGIGLGDSALLVRVSALLDALNGGYFGKPVVNPNPNNPFPEGLEFCRTDDGSNKTGMIQLPRDPAAVQPSVVNFHDKVCRGGDSLNGCTPDDATPIAKAVFDETWRLLSERAITGNRVMLGETNANQNLNCDGFSPGHALWQAEGFTQSQLYSNHAALTTFRPWENATVPAACYREPLPLTPLTSSGPPTAVLVKAYDPATAGYRLAGAQDVAPAAAKTFQFLFMDPDGASAITRTDALFNERASDTGGCSIRFFPASNQVQLMNDAGTSPVALNGQGKYENGECIVDPAGVSKAVNGAKLTVTIPVQFRIYGPRQAWMRVYENNSSAPASDWGPRTPRPIITSVTPASGSSSSQTFTLSSAHPSEGLALTWADILINYDLNGYYACYARYERAENRIRLLKDFYDDQTPDPFVGTLTPGTAGSLSNSQCTISTGVPNIQDIHFDSLNPTMDWKFNVSFKPAFTGERVLFTAVGEGFLDPVTEERTHTDWEVRAVNKVPGGTPDWPKPQIASWSPASGGAANQTFTVAVDDQTAGSNIYRVWMVFNKDLDGANACYLVWTPGNQIYLVVDAGPPGLLGPVTPGGAPVSNSQCRLNGVGTSGNVSGTRLTLNVNLDFNPNFSGHKMVYAAAQTTSGNTSLWKPVGVWDAPVVP